MEPCQWLQCLTPQHQSAGQNILLLHTDDFSILRAPIYSKTITWFVHVHGYVHTLLGVCLHIHVSRSWHIQLVRSQTLVRRCLLRPLPMRQKTRRTFSAYAPVEHERALYISRKSTIFSVCLA